MDYALIIVDYKGLAATAEYILQCNKNLIPKAEKIVVVENADLENDLEILSGFFGEAERIDDLATEKELFGFRKDGMEILYCRSGANLGFAKGNNLGAELAELRWKTDYYIVSNNDLRFETPQDLSVAEKIFAENERVGVVGPAVVTPSGDQQSPKRLISASKRLIMPSVINIFTAFCKEEKRKRIWNKHCCDIVFDAESGVYPWVSGCFMIIRAEAFRKADKFDPHTFLYAEEPILYKRMERVGYVMYFCKDLKVVHEHGGTTKKALPTLKMVKIEFQADCYFYRRYVGTSAIKIGIAKMWFGLYSLFFKLKRKLKGE